MGDPHGDVLSRMTPCSSSCCNCFFTSLAFIIDYLYSQIFVNGESSNSWISCPTSLLGGIHLCSRNASLYAYNNSSNCCFCFLVHPSRDALPLIDSYTNWFSLKNNKTYFLLELINFLAWLALTSEISRICVFSKFIFFQLVKMYGYGKGHLTIWEK